MHVLSETTHDFISAIFLFFLSQGVVYFCNNFFVSLFYRIVVPSIASNRKMMLDLDFCAGTDFCCSPFYFCKITEKLFKSANFCAWSSDMYAFFISFEFFDLSNVSASKKFVFADCSVLDILCLLFCILSFTSVEWNSFLGGRASHNISGSS